MPATRPRARSVTMSILLVATDGSEAALAALAEAIALAAELGAGLAVITVWQALQGDYGLAYPPAAMLDDLLQAERRHAEAALLDAAERAQAAGVPVRTRLATGDPVERICAYAREIDARLIAVGTRGHGTVASLILGSVSNGVIRNASRPVLVVRVPDGERERAGCLRLVVEHAVDERVAHELGAGLEAELLHDVRPVRLGGAHRDEQHLRDLLIRVAEREQAQHLALPVGERVARSPPGRVDLRLREPGAERRMHVAPTRSDLAHRLHDLGVGRLLQHVAARAGGERLANVRRIVLHREHQHASLGCIDHLGAGFETRAPRHDDVEEHDIGLLEARCEDTAVAVARLPDHLDVVLAVEQEPQACSDDCVIVDDEDADRHGSATVPLSTARSGAAGTSR